MLEIRIGGALLKLVKGDISEHAADGIVNAANPSLMGGGGVDGAIHRKGGPAILEECKNIRAKQYPQGLPTGQAVSTTAGKLPAKRVIHTVGPIWNGGGNQEAEMLASAYRNCLRCAADEGMRTIAFPSISTGAYGYPKPEAARIAVSTVNDFLRGNDVLSEVHFVLFSREDLEIFSVALEELHAL
jgi:O-acetyl-ADP-ribose deacetylase (regulator of RNase III)